MNPLDGIDPELRAPLEELRATFPGGWYAVEDLAERRRTDAMLAAETLEAVKAAQTCSTEDVRVPGADVARHMWTVRFRALRKDLGIQPVPID